MRSWQRESGVCHQREEIALLKSRDAGVGDIALQLGRDPGAIYCELRRNAATRGGNPVYRAGVAQWKTQQGVKRLKAVKISH